MTFILFRPEVSTMDSYSRRRRRMGANTSTEEVKDICNQPIGMDLVVKDVFCRDYDARLLISVPRTRCRSHFGGKFKPTASGNIMTEQVPRGIQYGPYYFPDKFDEVDRRSLRRGRPSKRKKVISSEVGVKLGSVQFHHHSRT